MKSRAAILRRSARRGAAFLGAVAAASFVGMIASADRAEADEKADLLKIAQTRQLSTDDMLAAAATYTPTGHKDEFVCLNSGGQAASVIVYAVPSMRILKYIPTGAPDSSAGFSYDVESRGLLNSGAIDGRSISWGDTHHPAFSETDGKYDGRFAFINDKANPRVFVIDLRDFETKQIVPNPIFRSEHGGAFVTPNTEYVIESAQYSAPPDRTYRPMTQANFNKYWRGGITYHKFDRAKGRIDPDKSFTILAPPYIQDLSDAGKGESAGWSFTNSLCSERYVGGIEKGRPPWEAGCSARDMDYMHIVNWKKAAEIVAAGRGTKINGHNVIPMELAAKEGILFLVPEAKSPHGVDVDPTGEYIVAGGKLATVIPVHSFQKMIAAIDAQDFEDTVDGIPVLRYESIIAGEVENAGLGPL
ncbi:MAG: cytochrome C, partial [Candidatus Accumulibacter sp.]|nr:cytochrome C [Accumulibacter sp.]